MSDNKKYYYLKLKEDFFDSEEMKVLESMPNGIEYQNVYLKMCLLSLKSDGALMFKNMIPYSAEMLSSVLRVNIDTVRAAISLFAKMELITITDTETIYMSDIQALVGQSSTEAERIKKYRQSLKAKETEETLPEPESEECTDGVQMYEKCTPENRDKSIELRDIDTHTEENNDCVCDFIPQKTEVNTDSHYPGISDNQKQLGKLQKDIFELIQAHNKSVEVTRKIPISSNLMSFLQKESRELFNVIGINEPVENVRQAVINFIQVAESDTWKTAFTWSHFCNKYIEYTPEYFSLQKFLTAEYEGNDATKKPENVFFFAMKNNPRFKVDLFERHVKDWKDAGRPQGEAYFKLQKEWEVA